MNTHPASPLRLFGLAFVAALVAACGGGGTTPALSAPPPSLAGVTLALVHGSLIDGTGAAPIPDATVLIAGDRIAAVGPSAQLQAPAGVKTVDLRGASILPGFIDAHVHFAFDKANLRGWAEGGVTTVRDEGAFSPAQIQNLKALKAEIAADPHLARLVSMGQMLKLPGGYGQREVGTIEEARQVVLEEIANGVDGIKIANEDGYAGQTGLPTMTPEMYKAIVDLAHEHGLPVSGHITSGLRIQTLLDAGVDDIGHAPIDYLAPEVLQTMAQRKTFLTPTFSVYKTYGVPAFATEQNVGALAKAGVPIALGDDFGGNGGTSDFTLGIPMVEIEEMAASGMTPMQIVQAATLNGAKLLRLDRQLGTLEAGKIADVLVVSGDPLADLQAFRQVRLVVHGGTIIREEVSG